MNPVTTYLVSRFVLLRGTLNGWLEARSTRASEEGSHTTDVILWAVAVVVIAAIAVAAITAYIQTQTARLA